MTFYKMIFVCNLWIFIPNLLPYCVYIAYTGFSSGALLACMVTSALWKEYSYIGSDELKAHTMCLTFGQPIINMPCISDMAQNYPDFTATIHQVYLKSDLIPQIFLCAASGQISLVITDEVSSYIHSNVTC